MHTCTTPPRSPGEAPWLLPTPAAWPQEEQLEMEDTSIAQHKLLILLCFQQQQTRQLCAVSLAQNAPATVLATSSARRAFGNTTGTVVGGQQ